MRKSVGVSLYFGFPEWDIRQGRERVASVQPKKRIPQQMHGLLTKLREAQRQHPVLPSIVRRTNTSDRPVSDQGNQTLERVYSSHFLWTC
jgi:hypothetical protein